MSRNFGDKTIVCGPTFFFMTSKAGSVMLGVLVTVKGIVTLDNPLDYSRYKVALYVKVLLLHTYLET